MSEGSTKAESRLTVAGRLAKRVGVWIAFVVGAAAVAAAGWVMRNGVGILFAVGLVSLTIGFGLYDTPLGFITFGGVLCGLPVLDLVLSRTRRRQGEGGDA